MDPEAVPDDAGGVRPADLSWLGGLAQLRRLFRQLPTKVRVVLAVLVIVVEVAIGWRIGLNAALPAYLFFGAVGWLVALNDAFEHRVPNAVLLPAYPIAAALLVVASAVDHQWYGMVRGAIGMFVLASFYLALALLRPGELGFGDVKLAGLIGLVLGWLGWQALAIGAFGGPALGAVGALVLVAARRGKRRTTLPFAPFLVVGALVAILTR